MATMSITPSASTMSDGYNVSIGCLGLAAGTISVILCYQTIQQINAELKNPFLDKHYRKALENSKKWYKILTGIGITGGVLSAGLATLGAHGLYTREERPQMPNNGGKNKDEDNPNKNTSSEKDKIAEKNTNDKPVIEKKPINNKNTFVITENELKYLMKMKKQFEEDPETQYNVPAKDEKLSAEDLALLRDEQPKKKPAKQQPNIKGLSLYFRPQKVTDYIEEFDKQYNVEVYLPEDGSDIEITYPTRIDKKKSTSFGGIYSPITKITQNDFFDFRGQLGQKIENLFKDGKKKKFKNIIGNGELERKIYKEILENKTISGLSEEKIFYLFLKSNLDKTKLELTPKKK